MDDQKPMPSTDDDAVDTSGSTGGTPVDEEEEETEEAPAPVAEPGIGEPMGGEAPVKADEPEADDEEEIE